MSKDRVMIKFFQLLEHSLLVLKRLVL